ncbi:hypothetical protein [Granulicella sp. S156]|uniref:hypothetical protein n=1 Tax=Granulicella sp. S156 TaxID=1747224 RepID=UPI00131AB2A9|nr:hypothetical protein [Granulicella sp. S156]
MAEDMLRRSVIRRHPVLTGIALLLLLSGLSGALYLSLYTDPTITTESGVVETQPAPLDLRSSRLAILTVQFDTEGCFDLSGQLPDPFAEQYLAHELTSRTRSITLLPNGSLMDFMKTHENRHTMAEACDSVLSSDIFTRPSPDLAQALQHLGLDAVLMVTERDDYQPFQPNFMTAASAPDTNFVTITGVLFGADGARFWSYETQLAGTLREHGLASNLLHLEPSMSETRRQTAAVFAEALTKPRKRD